MLVTVPFFSVLAHTDSSSVARGGVTARPLTDLKADATAGAAGRPGRPGSPGSISGAVGHLHADAMALLSSALGRRAVTRSGPAQARAGAASSVTVSAHGPAGPGAETTVYCHVPHRALGNALLPLAHPHTLFEGGAFLQQHIPATVWVSCTDARFSVLVVAASLEWDFDDLVTHAHVELAAAVQDQQTPDDLPLPGREQLNLLQKAAAGRLVERREHFADRAVICGQVDDVKQRVFALHHVHSYVREAHVVLHKVGHGNHRLDHLMH